MAAYIPPETVKTLLKTQELNSLMTIIRDKTTSRSDFIFYSDRIIRSLIEEALNHLPYVEKRITTPTGIEYLGLTPSPHTKLCGVSILRAGEAMEQSLRETCRSIRIGKILIQRDESTALPKLFYSKLPPDISGRFVLLLDPMLATGGSAIKAIEVLIEAGVPEHHILFVNLISCPEGLDALTKTYPKVTVVTGWIDAGLNEQKYIVPGLGDFGCRYFGTLSDDD